MYSIKSRWILLPLLLTQAFSAWAQSSTEAIEQANLPAVVSVEFEGGASGSGFVVGANGVIVTSYHLVKNAKRARVYLQRQREKSYPVEGIVTFARGDLALIKISAEDLPVVRMGYSSNVEKGEKVIAIKGPKSGLPPTKGVVTEVGPVSDLDNVEMILHTGKLGFGSSGGPLLNEAGDVIGVNTADVTRPLVGLGDLEVDVVEIVTYLALPVNYVCDAISTGARQGVPWLSACRSP